MVLLDMVRGCVRGCVEELCWLFFVPCEQRAPMCVSTYLFIGEFAIFRVLTHLVPYLKIQRILVNELTSMTPKSKNTCRKLRVSAFKRY
jgi:hypothetical protein